MFKRLAVLLFLAACCCTAFAQSAVEWSTYRTDGHAKSNGITVAQPGSDFRLPHVDQLHALWE